MKIIEVETKGFRRFALNNINTLNYKPLSTNQVIISTNGAGKSSLLREILSPLPVDIKKDFTEGGYKRIHIEHRNSTYHIASGIGGSTKHSFIKDDIELNDGGTRKMQLTLVKEYLQYTPKLHEIFTGMKAFTGLSIAERKAWFTDISTTDYTYAIDVYNKTKYRLRDVQGGIKILNNKLSNVNTQMIDESALQEYLLISKTCKELIRNGLDSKSDITYVEHINIDKLNREARALMNKLKLNKVSTNKTVDELKIEQTYLQKSLDKDLKALNDLSAIKHSNRSVEQLTEQIKTLNHTIDTFKSQNHANISADKINHVYHTLVEQYESIITHLDLIEEAPDDEDLIRLSGEIEGIVTTLRQHTTSITRIEIQLDNIVNQGKNPDTTCTKCGHTWKEGYDVDEHRSLSKTLDRLRNHHTELTKKHKERSELHNSLRMKNDAIQQLLLIFKDALSPVWTYVTDGYDVSTDTTMVKSRLVAYVNNLKPLLTLEQTQQTLEKVELEYKHAKNTDQQQRESELHRISILQSNVDDYYKEIASVKNTQTRLQQYTKIKQELALTIESISSAITTVEESYKTDLSVKRNQIIDDLIGEAETRLNEVETKLGNIEYNIRLKKTISDDIRALENTSTVLNKMVSAMSPTSGLIAKSINGFLGLFVADMNAIIASVWSYDLAILPCEVSDGKDLDYKFKVVVGDGTPNDDVSKTSAGQQEIINLAFVIVSMKYLGLLDYPLYLDEVGQNLDTVHRERVLDVERFLGNIANFSQVFLISHFAELFMKKNNDTEVVVLSSDNVYMNDIKEYNTRIKIT